MWGNFAWYVGVKEFSHQQVVCFYELDMAPYLAVLFISYQAPVLANGSWIGGQMGLKNMWDYFLLLLWSNG